MQEETLNLDYGELGNIQNPDFEQNLETPYFDFFSHLSTQIPKKISQSSNQLQEPTEKPKQKDSKLSPFGINQGEGTHLGIPTSILETHNKSVHNDMVGHNRKKKKKRVGRKIRDQRLESHILDFIRTSIFTNSKFLQ